MNQIKKDGYSRVEVALKLKETIAKKAKENLKTHTENGYQGLSNLTEAVDTRKEVADLAGVSTGNVSKVEYIQTHAPEKKEWWYGDSKLW